MQPVDDGFEADLIDEAHHEAVMEALGENIDLHAEVKTLRARVAELEALNKALEGMWDVADKDRCRYRKALEQIQSLDYANAATNCCAYTAHQTATDALKG